MFKGREVKEGSAHDGLLVTTKWMGKNQMRDDAQRERKERKKGRRLGCQEPF